ncbi:ubiquitin-specific protease doa4 [Coniochaeta pulveracea]|uniref:ubiquitinyl hydrolase 1 n=1 Tax=Coniochaeta pulveracea TaxID=177199 RepID=A0A420YAE6_9PEZI|nr:ubiquitin-specific protease doa4 [Coniochaeta pulveracea]
MTSCPRGVGAPVRNEGHNGGRRHYRHVDDITRARFDIDSRTPVDKLVANAERFIKQAELSKSIGRIDVALSDFIATITYLDAVKRHPDFAFLDRGKTSLWERYKRLNAQIRNEIPAYEKIKADIKADNVVTGAQPSQHGSTAAQPRPPSLSTAADGSATSRSSQNGTTHHAPAAHAAKARPVVHPKPQALHGKAIDVKAAVGRGVLPADRLTTAEGLKERLARLANSPGTQSPHPNTNPSATPSFSGDTLPGLPTMPAAIYSPARGSISTEASQLPSSTSGRYSMTRSMPSPSMSSAPFKSPFSNGTDTPAAIRSSLSMVPGAAADGQKRTSAEAPVKDIVVPEGRTVSVHELQRLLEAGEDKVKVLLIDIRDRARFEEYHIKSPATICIEPEVLMRKSISAAEVSESMVVDSAAEQMLFEKRADFDVIVMYDQDSKDIISKGAGSKAVLGLYQALTLFDYSTPNAVEQKPPKLLRGGLDAWVAAVETSAAHGSPAAGRSAISNSAHRRSSHVGPLRRTSSIAKPLDNPAEVQRWEEIIHRTTAEYLQVKQRYPALESMTSPVPVSAPLRSTRAEATPKDQPRTADPFFTSAPKRPAPAASRTSYCGLADRDHDLNDSRSSAARSPGRRRRKGRLLVGLTNPRNWCYANSSLQAMYATPGFAEELFDGHWQSEYKVPMKPDEKIANPQLMARMLTQLFAWMNKGMLQTIEATTFMGYLKHIHVKEAPGRLRSERDTLGGSAQQDAREFFSFILTQIDDETNRHRDKKDEVIAIKDNDPRSLLHNAVKYWEKHTTMHDSLITKYFEGLMATTGHCLNCRNRTVNFESFNILDLIIPLEEVKDLRLEALLRERFKTETLEDYKCEACGTKPGRAQRQPCFARLPDRLIVSFQRGDGFSEEQIKDNRKITFPFRNLNLTKYFIPPGDERRIESADAETLARDNHYNESFVYDCYAVVCHLGETLKSGHYIAYTRDDSSNDPTDWIKYNDHEAHKIKVTESGRPDDCAGEIYQNKKVKGTAYLVFYERRGT